MDTSEACNPVVAVRDLNLTRALESCERTLTEAALDRSSGSQVEAARLLGVTPRTVFNLVRRHGLGTRPSRRPPSDTQPAVRESMLVLARREA